MPRHADIERDALTGRWEKACREADNTWMRYRGHQVTADVVAAAARQAGQTLPAWAAAALAGAQDLARKEHQAAEREVDAAWQAFTTLDRVYAATAPIIDRIAGTVTR